MYSTYIHVQSDILKKYIYIYTLTFLITLVIDSNYAKPVFWISYPHHSHVLIIPMFSTQAANATAPNAEFLAHGFHGFFWPHTNKTEIWEQGEEIGKVLFIVLLNLFILFSQTDQTVCNFLIFGWLASISKETNNVSFFQTCMIYSQKLKNSTPPKKTPPQTHLGVQNIKSPSSRPPNVKDLSHDLLDKPFPILHTWLSHWPAPFSSK